jgi:hypothetical protein
MIECFARGRRASVAESRGALQRELADGATIHIAVFATVFDGSDAAGIGKDSIILMPYRRAVFPHLPTTHTRYRNNPGNLRCDRRVEATP